MQAHHQQPQRPMTPGQIRPPMQAMSAGMAPPGMLVHGQMGPQPNGSGQPNGTLQQGPPGPMPLPPGQVASQQRQPIPPQQGQPPPPQPQPQGPQQQQQPPTPAQRLSSINEKTWMQMGSLAEFMNEPERALTAYDSALRHNPYSQAALTQIANIYRSREEFEKAVEYFQRIVNIDNTNGEIWGAIGNCYLMLDELPKAYQAYQQAIYHLPDPKEPKLWYGIGILYDRYGSYDHAEEAFGAVMRMDPNFDKATEIYFRLGIIHKCQGRYEQSLQCFNYILKDPPKPLTETDIWFQIGNVYELQKEYGHARDAYERVLQENPEHGKVLQQLGALYFRPNTSLTNIDAAIQLLMRAIEVDKEKVEAHTWYLLGRCYMVQRLYNKAYEAYQQAVYRDGNNATYWCSIGVLYYQINQYRDALDAYSRAIRINPYLSEVWFDLGALYEACNNQVNDAIDAYTRAAELDRSNAVIEQRLEILRRIQTTGQTGLAHGNPPPAPIDPPAGPTTAGQPNVAGGPTGESAAAAGGAPGSLGAPPMAGPAGSGVPQPQEHMRHPSEPQQHPPPQRGGPPPPGMQHPGQNALPPGHAQQQQPKLPPHQQGPMPAGRPGYPDEAGYPRYDSGMPRPETGASGAPAQAPHYPVQQGPANSSAYPSQPYTSAPYSQPPASRPYSTPGMPQSSAAYTPQPQHPPSGPFRPAEDRRMSSRTDSPMLTQQQQQQSTSAGEHAPPASTFSQGPVNGYAAYPGQPALSDARHHSRSPSQAQELVFRQQQQQQQQEISRHPTREERPIDYVGESGPNHSRQASYGRYPLAKTEGMPPPSSVPPFSQATSRGELRAQAGDKDGDVHMEDASSDADKSSRDKAPGSGEKPSQYGNISGPSSSGASSATMAPINLPQISTPTPGQDSSAPSAAALSGPTAAPIRLPPVQLGGAGGFGNPNTRSPLSTGGAMQQSTLAAEDASKGSTNGAAADGPLSLASAISAADDDNEGSAINSLMSLSNVATTLTSRPQNPSPLPALSSPANPPLHGKHAADSAKPASEQEPPAALGGAPAAANGGDGDAEIASPTKPQPTDAPVASMAADDNAPLVSKVSELAVSTPTQSAGTAVPSGTAETTLGDSAVEDVNGRAEQPLSPSRNGSPGGGSSSKPASAGSAAGPAAVVPSKRPLSSPVVGPVSADALSAAKSKTPESVDSSALLPSDNANNSKAGSSSDDAGNSNDGGSDMGGPRKRGRQSSPTPVPERKQQQPGAAGKGSHAQEEMEEGEEPEDGEVFEDDEMSTDANDKPHKSEDVVMDSGKVKHD